MRGLLRLLAVSRPRDLQPLPRRPKLFQYWDEETPPPDVAGWVKGFRDDNPDFEHVLFSARSAEDYIARRFGSHDAAAFRSCAVPAMQADLIRLFALIAEGGLYIDVDHQSRQPLSGLMAQADRSLMFCWLGLLNNGLMVFPQPEDAFLQACLRLALDNVRTRRRHSALMATGPGVFNAVRALLDPAAMDEMKVGLDDPGGEVWRFDELVEHARGLIPVTDALREAYAGMTQMNPIAATIWIGMEQPAYKQTDRHWTRWQGPAYV